VSRSRTGGDSVRASNTQPILVMRFEASTTAELERVSADRHVAHRAHRAELRRRPCRSMRSSTERSSCMRSRPRISPPSNLNIPTRRSCSSWADSGTGKTALLRDVLYRPFGGAPRAPRVADTRRPAASERRRARRLRAQPAALHSTGASTVPGASSHRRLPRSSARTTTSWRIFRPRPCGMSARARNRSSFRIRSTRASLLVARWPDQLAAIAGRDRADSGETRRVARGASTGACARPASRTSSPTTG